MERLPSVRYSILVLCAVVRSIENTIRYVLCIISLDITRYTRYIYSIDKLNSNHSRLFTCIKTDQKRKCTRLNKPKIFDLEKLVFYSY